MTRVLAIVAVAAAGVFAGLYFVSGRGGTKTVTVFSQPCGDQRIFGHIRSMARKNGRYELRFDPATFTVGLTANTAAVEDGAIPRGQSVPNDSYVVDETHRTYLYYVSPHAHVTVLTPKSSTLGSPITVAQLAALVRGAHPVRLFEPLESGVWIRVHVDTICDVAQQFHP